VAPQAFSLVSSVFRLGVGLVRLGHQVLTITILWAGFVGFGLVQQAIGAQNSLTVRVEKWLQVQNFTGQVTYTRQGQSRAAKVGDRLERVGDAIATADKAKTTLFIDTNIGTVEVAAKTRLQVQTLTAVGDQGRITRLLMPYGRARLKLRKFTSPNSRFEIETPTGVGSVRGTDFAINLQAGGKLSIVTLQGAVESSAQGQSVLVPAGFQSLTMPGKPPTPPVPLREDLSLDYDLEKSVVGGIRQIRLVGKVDPVNAVTINGRPQPTDELGQFRVFVPVVSYPKVSVLVITPLGTEKQYDLAF
jgi:FecR protein